VLAVAFLIIAASAIAAYARGRGGSPWMWGTAAVVGYFLFAYVVPLFVRFAPDSDANILLVMGGFLWVGAVAFSARHLLGIGRTKPTSMWTCPNCKFLNQRYAVQCEACKQPYGEPVPPAQLT